MKRLIEKLKIMYTLLKCDNFIVVTQDAKSTKFSTTFKESFNVTNVVARFTRKMMDSESLSK